MKRESGSSRRPEASNPRPGMEDPVVALMRLAKVPVTRKNYLDLAYMGRVPNELSAEEEANLPDDLAKG
jgi:hypothetical protein